MSQRIVVVDDSRTVCGVVEWAYHGSGIEVLPALTGAEALAAIRKSPPIAVIVDYSLPDMGAAAFVAALRADAAASKVPILLLTGGYHPIDTAAVLAAGADEELRKPFKTAELLARVQAARDRGAGRGYFAGARPAAPPPLRPMTSPPASIAPAAPPAGAAPLIAPPPLVAAQPGAGSRPGGLIAPPPAAGGALVAPPPPAVPAPAAASTAFTSSATSPRQPVVASPGVYGSPSPASSGAHRVTPPPPSGLRSEEREALLRALQPVVLEQVKSALPGIVREMLPAMLREVLGAVMREQLGGKVEEYSRQRVDLYVERELPQAAEAAIERYLSRLNEAGEGNG